MYNRQINIGNKGRLSAIQCVTRGYEGGWDPGFAIGSSSIIRIGMELGIRNLLGPLILCLGMLYSKFGLWRIDSGGICISFI